MTLPKPIRRSHVSLVAILLLLAATDASSQPVPPRRLPPPPVRAAAQLKVRKLPVRADLKQHLQLRGKKQLSANMQQRIQAAVSYTPKGEPRLTLSRGKQVVLEQVDTPVQVPKALLEKSRQLSRSLTRYSRYISKTPYLRDRLGKLPIRQPRTSVSHKARQTPIKDQGDRGTCVAHAAMAGLESWYKWKNNVTRDLSEQHAYQLFMEKEGKSPCYNAGLQTWRAADYLTANRVCTAWNYSPIVPSCNTTTPQNCSTSASHGYTATQTFFSEEFGGAAATAATNTNYLEALLDQGHDLIYGIYVAGPDWTDGTLDSGIVDVYLLPNGDPAYPYAGHAMLLVGYDRPGGYFEFKNSWGTGQGHGGYVRLSYEYVQTYGKYGYYITGATNP